MKITGLHIGDKLKLTINDVAREYNITGSYNTVADSGQKFMMTTETLKESITEYSSSRTYVRLNNKMGYENFKTEVEREFKGVAVDKKWPALENSVESIWVMLESISGILVAIFIMFSILNIVIVVMIDNKNWRRKLES
ncbi:MAG: ABC transporter permease family protein [Ruminiclostridium sp.]